MTLKGEARRNYMREYMRRRRSAAEKPADKREPDIAKAALSMSAQDRLDAAIRQHKRKLDLELERRMRAINEEVRQRVLKEGKAYLDMLNEREQKAQETIALYREWKNNGKPIYTPAQFNLIRKCLHQGGIAARPKEFDEAFDLIQRKKLQLTGAK